ncbi:hypothetical protein GCM10023347_44040 [Streptomyces chumphonensis]|uniref:CchlQ n=1 Tax=Streptomyces chumphonensis TaxID=1214925 RepID=A0A927F0I9_9ACTN|nr:CchlQ [Streptomyces chumphonensis]MBD3932014.1 CchlQ [Streptomyces chumphonensis]
MDWGTLIATVSGGSIAITGTVLADHLRHRREGGRELAERRRAVSVDFIGAAETCHARLRQLAQESAEETGRTADELAAQARAALADSGLGEARERLFIDASATVAGAGQTMFQRLRALQAAVAAGAQPSSAAFHNAYHPYIGAVWAYRVAVRAETEGRSLTPETFGWSRWDGTDRCTLCPPPTPPLNP